MNGETSSLFFVQPSYWWAGVKLQQPPIETLKLNSLPVSPEASEKKGRGSKAKRKGRAREKKGFLLDFPNTESRGIN